VHAPYLTARSQYRKVAREFDRTKVKFISGDLKSGQWGRFGHALFAKTPYVIIYDDNSIPGRRAAEQIFHIMHITSGEYFGMYGMRGCKLSAPLPSTSMSANMCSALVLCTPFPLSSLRSIHHPFFSLSLRSPRADDTRSSELPVRDIA